MCCMYVCTEHNPAPIIRLLATTTTAKILESHTQENESLTYEIIIIIFINNIDKN